MIVQVHDHSGEQQPLLAAFDWAAPDRPLEAVEEPDQILRRASTAHVLRQTIHALVGGAQRTRRAAADEVIAERLLGPSLSTCTNRRSELFRSVVRISHATLPFRSGYP